MRCRLFGHRFGEMVLSKGLYITSLRDGVLSGRAGLVVTARWRCDRCGGERHMTRWADGSGPTPVSPGVPSL